MDEVAAVAAVPACRLCTAASAGATPDALYREAVLKVDPGDAGSGQAGSKGGGDAPAVCPICLGVLQQVADASWRRQVASQILAEQYDAENFTLNISVPGLIVLRQCAAALSANKPFNEGPAFEVKAVVRHVLATELVESLGIPESPTSRQGGASADLTITVAWSCDQLALQELPQELLHTDRQRKCPRTGSGRGRTQRVVRPVSADRMRSWVQHADEAQLRVALTVPPVSPSTAAAVSVTSQRLPVILAGRYCKLERGVSHSCWTVNGVKVAECSVEQLIAPSMLRLCRADEAVFGSSGREDIDVRMLGDGRPFVFEMKNARHARVTDQELQDAMNSVNTAEEHFVSISRLCIVSQDKVQLMRTGESDKQKVYRAVCHVSSAVSAERMAQVNSAIAARVPLTLRQKTPIRVLHRRAPLTREKQILSLQVERINDHWFVLDLVTSAGTYVKEFVHGDMGRTTPSLGELIGGPGCQADIVQLDVAKVELDFP